MYSPARFVCLILLVFVIYPVVSFSEPNKRDLYPDLQQVDLSTYNRLSVSDADSILQVQVTDTIRLDEIIVRSTRIYESLRYQPVDVQQIDSLRIASFRSRPVSAVLSRYSSLFIRDNGPGGLATLSQRGLSASQTQVLWEGFPINSLSLGLSDLSVIPAGLFSAVEVSPGTPSSAFGGGSLGGTVYLSSNSHQQNQLELLQSAGAFGTRNSQLHGAFSGERLSGSVKGIYNTAKNDFTFFNRATGQEDVRSHNAGSSGHLMGNVSYRLPETRIYSSLWIFDNDEQIPGSILAGNNPADQTNSGMRWLTGVETMAGELNIRPGLFIERDRFTYKQPSANIDSRFRRGRVLAEIDFSSRDPGVVNWQGGASGGSEMVDTNNYGNRYQRYLWSVRLNPEIRLFNRRLRLTPTSRVDGYSDFGWVFSPSLGANLEVVENRFYLRGMSSYDFNPPSFNDLYWVPSGNPHLEPERSLKLESGVTYTPESPLFDSFSITGYQIRVDNGIYWFPDQEGVWTPSNVEKVNAGGLEAHMDASWQIHAADVQWSAGVDWRRTVLAAPRFPGDQAVNRQMRYVPEWAARSDLQIRLDPVSLHASYHWSDRRFVTEDHISSLDGFQLVDLSASFEQAFLNSNWHFQLVVNNLLNEQYEIIQWYPMPGRHLTFTLGLDLPL